MSAISGAGDRRRPAVSGGARVRARLARTDGFGPALTVAMLLGLLVFAGLGAGHGNPTVFVHFGRQFVLWIQPPHGAVIQSDGGYDGQFFWALAHDPLILHARTLHAFAPESFRLQRVVYPALAYLLAGGRPGLIAWSLVAVNLLAIVAATLGFSLYARLRGWSGWWGLGIGLLPGLLFALRADLSDAVAVAALVGGLICYWERRRWPAATLLAVAVLAREPMALGVAAVAADAAHRAWAGARGPRARVPAVIGSPWPVAAAPALAFAGWHLYIQSRLGGSTLDPGTAFATPFVQFASEFHRAIHHPPLRGAWDLCYLALMLCGIVAAAALVWRRRSPVAVTALLFALTLPVLAFGDAISYTRLSAPVFACLLLEGLQRRSRGVLALCGAVALMGALLPFGVA